ncbi:hypothetical protein I203_104330 [Kwoniella mangroviensis CBS 8507]|uniref:uncharacterized protein n=1 Tax=Kwoniella mangroviensis CBS 8507 TaxID=1296122 RepID=UPI00080D0C35|nr:uncharacterized protein I203_00723 [Kwoniella mangroviensis CBS 8507]OCF70588.1 hypothetical protein I203_00723 [Kwoniella mangroviensis CBS 8507]
MSINQEQHSSLATLLYPPGTDARGQEDAESHLLDYLEHDYPHTETGEVSTHHVRTDQPPLAPLPGEKPPPPTGTSGVSSPAQHRTPQPSFTAYQPGEIPRSRLERSTSPLNPTIPIPNTLARLASQTISNLSLPDPTLLKGQEEIEQAALLADQYDRGEMGGKRRKLPHERAGWAEMDQQQQSSQSNPNGVKRRRTRKSDHNAVGTEGQYPIHVESLSSTTNNQSNLRNDKPPSNGTGNGVDPSNASKYENDFRQLTELSHTILNQDIDKTFDSLASSSVNAKDQAQPGSISASAIDPALSASPHGQSEGTSRDVEAQAAQESPDPKLSRAEQNKRAQQAFRRRREEHMKKLERDSAQLELVKRQMDQKDVLLRDLVLALESSKIETAALRSSIRFLIPHSSVFPLTEQGTLNLGEEVKINNDTPVSEEDVLNAFELLEKQAREVAKRNHARRE